MLLIAGEQDEIARPRTSTSLPPAAGRHPGGIPGVGHLIHYETRPRRGLQPLPEDSPGVKILIDARYTRLGHHDGISRYGARLIAAAAGRGRHDAHQRRASALAAADVPWTWSRVRSRRRALRGAGQQAGADVVVCPMQPWAAGAELRLVQTLHDLIYYRHPAPPRFLRLRLVWRLYHKAWWPQRVLLNRADVVATIVDHRGPDRAAPARARPVVGNAPLHRHRPATPKRR